MKSLRPIVFLRPLACSSLLVFIGVTGCVRRELTLTSDPPGALVFLNDQEAGRTPLTREFTWYGTYDVQLRKEGYETVDTKTPVIAPWWQWVPFDLVAEFLPLTDRQRYSYSLRPINPASNEPGGLMQRGDVLRERLESSPTTRATK